MNPFVYSGICAFIVFGIASYASEESADVENCDHPDCYLYAAELAAGVDWSISPCDDFYEFACGRWRKHADNTEKQIMVQAIGIQQSLLYDRVQEILESYIPYEEEALQKAQDLFRSCLQAGKMITANLLAIEANVLSLGGLYLGSTKTITMQDLIGLMGSYYYQTDIKVPFSIDTYIPFDNNSQHILQMNQPDPNFFMTNQFPFLTANDLVTIASYVFGIRNSSLTMSDAEQVLRLDRILHSIKDNSGLTHFVKLGDFDVIKNLDIFVLFNKTFSGIKSFSRTDELAIEGASYFDQFINFIQSPENAKIVANYITLNYIIGLLRAVGDSLPSPLREIRSLRPYNTESKEDQCLPLVLKSYEYAIARKYGEEYHDFSKELTLIEGLTTELFEIFRERLITLDWLDAESRNGAIEKLDNLKDFYHYPEWVTDLNKVNEYYNDTTSRGSYIGNMIASLRHNRKIQLLALTSPRDSLKWHSSTLDANAYYDPTENHIHILEGILQSPVFNMNRLRVMNYAQVAFILGHEISHGFDTIGVKFDEDGNLKDWLTADSKKNFDIRTKCLVDQYSNFKLTKEDLPGSYYDFQVNGNQTLREDVADEGGLKLSYYAYKKWADKNQNPVLPEILKKNFTEEQIYFLAFARTWCINYEFDYMPSLYSDTHSPGKFRVNGPLSNFPRFGEVFECAAGTPMVRGEESCSIW